MLIFYSPLLVLGERKGNTLWSSHSYAGSANKEHTVIFLLGKTGQTHKLTEQALCKRLKGAGSGGTGNALQGTKEGLLESFM